MRSSVASGLKDELTTDIDADLIFELVKEEGEKGSIALIRSAAV